MAVFKVILCRFEISFNFNLNILMVQQLLRTIFLQLLFSFVSRADQSSSDGGREKNTNRLNGFLNLKTPLISTKTLG